MKRKIKTIVSSMLACVIATLTLGSAAASPMQIASASKKEVETITVYPFDGNLTSGVVGGWLGEFFASKGFQLEVWAFSNERTNAILASGDLPDVMYINNQIYENMIQAKMLLNLDDYLDKMPNVQAYEPLGAALNYIREFRSAGTGGLYFMPRSVGVSSATSDTERQALRLNWPYYEAVGAPSFSDIWELIPVMKQMLESNPTDAEGSKNYGTVLNSGSDGTYWGNIVMPFYWHGYHEFAMQYLLEANMVDGTYYSILNEDSLYNEILKWYNALYREGLMDPDSITLDRPTQKAKVDNRNVMVPSGTNPGWETGGYYQYYLEDTQIYFPNRSLFGSEGIAINAKSSKKDTALKFIDMLASPDDYLVVRSGPNGAAWYSEDGEIANPTDTLLESLVDRNVVVKTDDGTEITLWNTSWICTIGSETSFTDNDGNPRTVDAWNWIESREIKANNENFSKWKETTGYSSWVEWLEDVDALHRDGPLLSVNSFMSKPDDMQQLTMDALRDIVVNASWQMVYADSDNEFDKLWSKMVDDCNGLGAQDIIDWALDDLEKAQEIKDSLME